MTYLTFDTLVDKGACQTDRDEFWVIFGKGVEVTTELCEKYADTFDFWWAGDNLLPDGKRVEFNVRRKTAVVVRENGYRAAHANYTVCGEKCEQISREYNLAVARAFGELYNEE